MTDVARNGGDQRRFARVGGATAQLMLTMQQWKNVVIDYEQQAEIAAQAEADYKLGIKAKVREFQLKEKGLSSAKANDMAEADEDIAQAHLAYLLEGARLDAMKKKIDWFRAEIDRLRSLQVDEREERKLDATYQPG